MPTLIKDKFEAWEKEAQDRFDQLKANEEELNKIFIDLYGLQDELDYHVEDKDVSVSLADRERDIKSLISYAVGCMFGRYSLDEEGLVFAGGQFDMGHYSKFKPDVDNILLLTDDEFFQNDDYFKVSKSCFARSAFFPWFSEIFFDISAYIFAFSLLPVLE